MKRIYNLPKHVCYDKASSKAAGQDWYDTSISHKGKQLKTKSYHTVEEAMFGVAVAAYKAGKWNMQQAGEYISSYTPDMGKEVVNPKKQITTLDTTTENLINDLQEFLTTRGFKVVKDERK